MACAQTSAYACYDVDEVYERTKLTLRRLREITGMDKPIVMSELNADGDVTGPFEQAELMKHFMERLNHDDEKWLSAFTMYQFRDDGRLGCETTDPNNKNIGIEQPLLGVYREQLHKPFFSQKIEKSGEASFPCTLRWSGAEDAEGFAIPLSFESTPHYCEVYFDGELKDLNLMMEFGGWWFYKAPGVKCIDLMSYFYENKIPEGQKAQIDLNFFAPPADGLNHPENGDPYSAEDGSWMDNHFTRIPSLPRVRIDFKPVQLIHRW